MKPPSVFSRNLESFDEDERDMKANFSILKGSDFKNDIKKTISHINYATSVHS